MCSWPSGNNYGSIVGFTYSYNDLDDCRHPTAGSTFSFSQGFAGFGGNLKFINDQHVTRRITCRSLMAR